MSKPPQKSSAGANIVKIVIGAVLMVAGMWVSLNWHPEFLHTLEGQGILLDPGKTVAIIGVFLILFPVLKSFFFDPLQEAIYNRTSDLERTFSEAEELRAEMGRMRSEYEQRLAATEASAREEIQSTIREAQSLRQQLMAEASAKADEMVARAAQEIELEKNKVMTELRLEVVNLALGATEKLLGENVDSDKNRRLVADFIEKVEVPS